MKYAVRGIGAVLALAIIYLTTAFFVPAVRLGPVYAPTYALAIHLGLVDVKTVDWGYLKLRAGDAGITALRWLEHNSAPQIAQVSVAVQAQWFEAGHVFGGGHLIPEWTQTQETRFNDLRMPPDAKQFPTALTSGQVIPASFWRDQRFRLCRNGGNCTLRMVDMTGDSLPEVIVEFYMTGTQGMYAKPVVFTSWTVYRKVSERWSEVSNIWPCEVEHTTATGRMTVSDQKPDTPWINRQAVNFFPAECFTSALTTDAPALEKNAAAKNIKTMDTYPLLPASKPFPPSLKSALANRQVDLPLQGWPPLAFDGKPHIRVQTAPVLYGARDMRRDGERHQSRWPG